MLRLVSKTDDGNTSSITLVPRHFYDGVVSFMHPQAPASCHAPASASIQRLFNASFKNGLVHINGCMRLGAQPLSVSFGDEFSLDEMNDPQLKEFALGSDATLALRTVPSSDGYDVNYFAVEIPTEKLEHFVDKASAYRMELASQQTQLLRSEMSVISARVPRGARPPKPPKKKGGGGAKKGGKKAKSTRGRSKTKPRSRRGKSSSRSRSRSKGKPKPKKKKPTPKKKPADKGKKAGPGKAAPKEGKAGGGGPGEGKGGAPEPGDGGALPPPEGGLPPGGLYGPGMTGGSAYGMGGGQVGFSPAPPMSDQTIATYKPPPSVVTLRPTGAQALRPAADAQAPPEESISAEIDSNSSYSTDSDFDDEEEEEESVEPAVMQSHVDGLASDIASVYGESVRSGSKLVIARTLMSPHADALSAYVADLAEYIRSAM